MVMLDDLKIFSYSTNSILNLMVLNAKRRSTWAMRVGTTVDSEDKNMFFIQEIRSSLKVVQQLATWGKGTAWWKSLSWTKECSDHSDKVKIFYRHTTDTPICDQGREYRLSYHRVSTFTQLSPGSRNRILLVLG